MANWGWAADGQYGAVFPTTDPVDDEEVFATFTEAKNALAAWFSYVAAAYHRAARTARQMRKEDALGNLHNLTDPGAV